MINTLIVAPLLSRSGYGEMSNQMFHALSTNTKLSLQSVATSWGSCVNSQFTKEKDKAIVKSIIYEQPKVQPDLFVGITIPHLQQPLGKYNVNVSCIVEVDQCYDNLIDGLNKYNLSIVSSQFAKDVLLNSPKKPTVPIEVVYLAADTSIYKPTALSQTTVDSELAKIKEDKAFLYVGQMTHGKLFCDRKDMDTLIKTFCETFAGLPNKPALILKTSGTNFSFYDRDKLLDRITVLKSMVQVQDLPSIYLLHGELSDLEMAALYTHPKVIANVSFTHGESFGLSTLQGSLCAKPFFIGNWSANNEIITEPLFLLDGSVNEIKPDVVSEYYRKGSKWFYCDTTKAKAKLLDFYNNPTLYNEAAKALAVKNADFFSEAKLAYRLNKVLAKYAKA